MKRLSIPLGLVATVLAFTWPDESQAQCKTRLIDKSFSCSFRSDSPDIPRGETCLSFEDIDEPDSPKFDLSEFGETSISGLIQYGCTCDPVGARFNASRNKFSCAGLEFFEEFTFPYSLQGRIAGRSGQRITAHQVDLLAVSFRLRCRIVPSCEDGSLSAQNAMDDQRQRYLKEYFDLREGR